MAATILGAMPNAADLDLLILATDIDPVVIEQARSGVYDARILGNPTPTPLRPFVQTGPAAEQIVMAPALRAMVRFEVLNLLHRWPFEGRFDVIFCRNVVIYFDADTRRKLWTRFATRLAPGGTLFIGHSERMDPALDPLFEPTGITQYRRTAQVVTADTSIAVPAAPARMML